MLTGGTTGVAVGIGVGTGVGVGSRRRVRDGRRRGRVHRGRGAGHRAVAITAGTSGSGSKPLLAMTFRACSDGGSMRADGAARVGRGASAQVARVAGLRVDHD